MNGFTKFQKFVLAGLGACGGALTLYYSFHSDRKRAFASWTTNYTPTCEWDSNWDKRDPTSLVKPSKGGSDDNRYNEAVERVKPKAVRHLLLIRHGQYNMSGKSDEERILTDLGRKQAKLTGLRLQELSMPYTRLVRSTMTRANETAQIILSSLPAIPVSDCCLLEEGSPIPPEPPIGSWKPEPCFYQDGARIEAAFRKYFYRAEKSQERDSYDILVCHANVIRYFVCRALQFPPEAWLRLSLHHASITWISVMPSGRVILRALGDTGHMPPDVITSS
ncbi:serine/threonine-protein phosphatase Pgam5, mitochondrial-like isoform X2 [Zootermopsis nevadensis]|uniref:serine/threonine-protein phosphatase Pgam5, mitochondrial-like isoform X2 n=1 Tax=Zootermopsis nevadensis TaxID=136037 RepID=UPI000B8E7D95|nr:serine/threonine-protein phosphatase Pgam5, mitochondrial-like isoform X2 [Zootermopsis nevadensis]